MRYLLNIILAFVVAFVCHGTALCATSVAPGDDDQIATSVRKPVSRDRAPKQEVPNPKAKEEPKKQEVPVKKQEAKPEPAKKQEEKPAPANEEKPKEEVAKPKPTTQVNTQYDGIDVSRYQRTIDWEELAQDKNVKYVYIKATEGNTFVDPKYRENLENARKAGFKVGSYHFMRTGTSIQSQFDHYTKHVKKHEQDLLPMLDVEVRQGWTAQQMRDSVKLFVDLLEEHYGCKPLIYTSASYFNNLLGRTFLGYPLFIARYSNTEPKLDMGAKWTLWQFSDHGRLRGIGPAVDLSRFNKGCSIKDLLIKDNKIGHRHRRNGDVVDKSLEKPASVTVKKEAPTMSKQQEAELKKQKEQEKKARERAEKLKKEDEKKREEQRKKEEQAKAQQEARAKAVRSRVQNNFSDDDAKKAAEQAQKEAQKKAKEEAQKKAKEEAQRKAKEAKEEAQKKAREEAQKKLREEQERKAKAEKEMQEKARAEQERLEKEEAKAEKEAQKKLKEEQERIAKEEAKQKAIAEKRAKAQAKAKAELEQEEKANAAKKAQQLKKQEQRAKLQQQREAVNNAAEKDVVKSNATPVRKRTNKSSADND